MNERIRELAKRADVLIDYGDDVLVGRYSISDGNMEKFAEMIVRECAGIVENKIGVSRYVHEAELLRECSATIKQHFGIE